MRMNEDYQQDAEMQPVDNEPEETKSDDDMAEREHSFDPTKTLGSIYFNEDKSTVKL